jgi:acetylornithine deacetylase
LPTIDREFVLGTLRDLVRIDSINPSLVPTAPGEAKIAHYVAQSLTSLGLEVKLHEPEPGRISVVGRWRGTGGGRSLMLNAHADTVGVEGMPDPFGAELRDGRVYGRGAYDMKGSLAACMGCVQALSNAGIRPAGDILVAAVADEEYASLGTADLVRHYVVDGAIVTEPSALQLCLAHKGFAWIEVETIGRAYHGSQFMHGIDANLRMGRVLAELAVLERELRQRTPHPLVGPPSLHAAMLHGGTGLSTYAASCTLQIERRTIPGETEAQVVGEIQAILDRLSADDPSFKATLRTLLVRSPFEVAPNATIVRALEAAIVRVTGTAPRHMGENPWMDSALLADAGVETVVCGPDGTGAHSAEEWVDVQSVLNLTQVLVETALTYCNA